MDVLPAIAADRFVPHSVHARENLVGIVFDEERMTPVFRSRGLLISSSRNSSQRIWEGKAQRASESLVGLRALAAPDIEVAHLGDLKVREEMV